MDKDAEIARLKAALEAERAACDEARTFMREKGYPRDATDNSHVASWCRSHDARRSAERAAQEKP